MVYREDQAAKQVLTIWTDPADVAKSSILHQLFVFSLAFCPHFFWSLRVNIGWSAGRKGVKGAQPGPVLDWMQRVKIAVGAARGLEYLHEKAQPPIIHRDIKSSNVLLFDDYVAKIADFNLSNQAPDMAARLHSTRVLGTFGYHAPE